MAHPLQRLLSMTLLALSLAGCSGPPVPDGWKSERWQAGFGSWSRGGEGVAYDIQMPKRYNFQQKCGVAWIEDDVDGPEFAIRLSYLRDPQERQSDFNDYLRDDAVHWYPKNSPPITFLGNSHYSFGPEKLSRMNFELRHVTPLEDDAVKPPNTATVKGFWLSGNRLSIISDLRGPKRYALNERIVASMKRVAGYGWLDLITNTIPGLLGC